MKIFFKNDSEARDGQTVFKIWTFTAKSPERNRAGNEPAFLFKQLSAVFVFPPAAGLENRTCSFFWIKNQSGKQASKNMGTKTTTRNNESAGNSAIKNFSHKEYGIDRLMNGWISLFYWSKPESSARFCFKRDLFSGGSGICPRICNRKGRKGDSSPAACSLKILACGVDEKSES